ncbi:MAG: DNA polymerase III subunit chi [Steroidobacteraceae bacterium]
MRADFYVLAQPAPEERLRLACRVAEKAYLAGQSALVWHRDRAELERFDALLWTFSGSSFVPHEWLDGADEAPVRLSCGEAPGGAIGVLINLDAAPEPPPWAGQAGRIAEIIDGEPARREAGRARFRIYRGLGYELQTHNMSAP